MEKRTMKRIVIVAIALIVLAGAMCALLLTGTCSKTEKDPLAGMRADAVNVVIDQSGIKTRIESELRKRGAEIADEAGIPKEVVDYGIDQLDIQNWKAVPQPDNLTQTGKFKVETDDVDALVTTYDDPSVVTIDAYGQSVTFEVPESAQSYVSLIQYLDYLQ